MFTTQIVNEMGKLRIHTPYFFNWVSPINASFYWFDFTLKLQAVSCDEFLLRTHAHSHTRFSAARTSHARVRFAQNSIAHALAHLTIFLKIFLALNFFLMNFFNLHRLGILMVKYRIKTV